jgi:hypothetical protein
MRFTIFAHYTVSIAPNNNIATLFSRDAALGRPTLRGIRPSLEITLKMRINLTFNFQETSFPRFHALHDIRPSMGEKKTGFRRFF